MTVSEMMLKMDSAEFTEWKAFFQLEPFGSKWDNELAALPAVVMANVNRGKGKRAFKVRDFLLIREAPKMVRQSAEDIKRAVQAIAEAFKGKQK